MDAQGYRAALADLELTQAQAAAFLGLDPRTSRRYALGEGRIPEAVSILLRLMIKKKLTPDKVSKLIAPSRRAQAASDNKKSRARERGVK